MARGGKSTLVSGNGAAILGPPRRNERNFCCHAVYTPYNLIAMFKTLTKHGNSYALVIDRPILELLQIDPERPVELSTDGNALTIRPVSDGTKAARVARSLKRINDRHGKALKRLGE